MNAQYLPVLRFNIPLLPIWAVLWYFFRIVLLNFGLRPKSWEQSITWRQFTTRDSASRGVIEYFEISLKSYINPGKARELGPPSVSYFADEQNLSPNYFGDLVKKETGVSAQDYIQARLIEVAKEKIFDPDKSVSEIAYELGFKYPQHFTRLFKKKVGYAPNEYRIPN